MSDFHKIFDKKWIFSIPKSNYFSIFPLNKLKISKILSYKSRNLAKCQSCLLYGTKYLTKNMTFLPKNDQKIQLFFSIYLSQLPKHVSRWDPNTFFQNNSSNHLFKIHFSFPKSHFLCLHFETESGHAFSWRGRRACAEKSKQKQNAFLEFFVKESFV